MVCAGRRALWRAYAERLGAVPEPATPWALLGIVAASFLILAGGTALILSRGTTSVNPATAIRAE